MSELVLTPGSSRQVFGSAAWHHKAARLVETGDADGAIAELHRILQEHPQDAAAHSQLIFMLHYRTADPAELYREHLAWVGRHAGAPDGYSFGKPRTPIRIGYVSPHFRELNPILSFIEPVLREHDRRRFHVTCYSEMLRPDSGTERARGLSDSWRDIAGLGDAEATGLIRSDRIDILVDLAGHLAGNRLLMFARRAAPVQVTWIGYPNTTGLDAIDYRLTDAIADPPGLTEAYHSEELVRLDTGFLCYQPPLASPPVSALPAWFAGHTTFGCFQYPPKINSQAIRCWAEVLERTPYSRLLLHHCFSDYSQTASARRSQIAAEFARHGIDTGRLDFAGALSERKHLELYGKVDLVLDTFPYNGTTGICEALWMGVPAIAMEGGYHSARVAKSILARVGLNDLVAAGETDYIERAARLARDLDRLAELRTSMRQRLRDSPVLAADRFTRELEARYLDMAARASSRNIPATEAHCSAESIRRP